MDFIAKGGKFASGEFKLGLRGDTVKAASEDFSLTVTITLQLEAQ